MKKIIGLAGEIGSGKGTVAKYLQEKYGAKTYRFSDFLRLTLDVWHLEKNRENLAHLSLIMRQGFGEDVFSRALAEEAKKSEENLIVFDGIRRTNDIKYLKEVEGFKFVYIETSLEKRYDRVIERGENSDEIGKSFEQFKKDHELETEREITTLKEIADVIMINDGSLEELYGKVDELLA